MMPLGKKHKRRGLGNKKLGGYGCKEGGEIFVVRKEVKRWLKALRIAKIIFEDEGYHTLYLEGIEKFIRRKLMYSPRIREEFLPLLFKISASKRIPMTRLVNQIIKDYLDKSSPSKREVAHDEWKSEASSGKHYTEI